MKFISCLIISPILVLGMVSSALAITPPAHLEHEHRLHFNSYDNHRSQRDIRWYAPDKAKAAYKNFMQSSDILESSPNTKSAWKIMWDFQTGVPSRIYGVGIQAPGAQKSSKEAELFSFRFLNRHLQLLAPGAMVSDFKVVTNTVTESMRVVGLKQFHKGLEVIGGQIHFRFKNNRLFVIGSEAFPYISAPKVGTSNLSEGFYQTQARRWLSKDFNTKNLVIEGLSAPKVLPFISVAGDTHYFTVVETTISSSNPLGKWKVYLDAASGDPVAREQQLMFYDGVVKVNASDRWPGRGRLDFPAMFMTTRFPLGVETTQADGTVTWGGEERTEITLGVEGDEVRVTNRAGRETEETKAISGGGEVVWDHRNDELKDAQLSSYVYANIVKAYTANIAPEMLWLQNEKVRVYVNIDDGECNAYSDGTTINFLQGNNQCENTGRLSDVVYHEFGHSFHAHALLPSVGSWDTALSEGASDYLAATITDDPAMGIGFFGSNNPLRHLNEDRDRVWPDDVGEDHQTGIIFGGAMWDLRTLLIEKHGEAGITITDNLWYQALQTSFDIPTSYVEIIAADDDDGDLTNGTPNMCEINKALGNHGLGDPIDFNGITKPRTMDNFVIIDQNEGFTCPGNEIASIELDWEVRDFPEASGKIGMEAANTGFEAMLPTTEAGTVLNYQVNIEFGDGTITRFPENPASPWYEHFVGRVIPLYCTSFESEAEREGWTDELVSGEEREGANDWQAGTPISSPGSGDPSQAADGSVVYGNDLGGGDYNGMYQPEKINALTSPIIETKGLKNIRLQYMRWLNVEDAFFDQASIYSNDVQVWQNLNSGENGTTHHQDSQWRFHDVDLSETVVEDKVQLRFELSSDGGLELGGWTVDEFCIVALDPEQPEDLSCPDCVAPTMVESCGGCSGSDNGFSSTLLMLLFGLAFIQRRRFKTTG